LVDDSDELFTNIGPKKAQEVKALFSLMRNVLKQEGEGDSFVREDPLPNASIPEALGIEKYLKDKEQKIRDDSLKREEEAAK
jgi:hypothetical protein